MSLHLKYVHKLQALNWKIDDYVLDSYWLDIIEKLWMSGAWILRFQNRNSLLFVLQIPGD